MESSQDYSFNKAHAACYALIAYRTAWLKANHPREYMAALISSVMNTKDRVPLYVNACREMGIEVLPPDVNFSQTDFAVVEGTDPLRAERGEERGRSRRREAIVRARGEGGPFASIWDLTERVDPQTVNKRALESLVKCGALDSTGATRLRDARERPRQRARRSGRSTPPTGSPGQASIFDGAFGEAEARGGAAPPADPDAGVRRARAPPAREGDARAVRVRASARARRAASSSGRPTARSPTSSAAATARS